MKMKVSGVLRSNTFMISNYDIHCCIWFPKIPKFNLYAVDSTKVGH